MGRKSTKENKNIYQLSREAADLTRDGASEQMVYISADRIEKIESGRSAPHPEEILTMSECYKNPGLCNYFCSHECPIGMRHVPAVPKRELPQVTLEVLATLNALVRDKDRLIEITADGKVSSDELRDFREIRTRLDRMGVAIDALGLWVQNQIAAGEMQEDGNL